MSGPKLLSVLALLPQRAIAFSVLVPGDFPYYRQSVNGVQKRVLVVRMLQACKHSVVNEANILRLIFSHDSRFCNTALVRTYLVCTLANVDYFLQFRLHSVTEPRSIFKIARNLASAMLLFTLRDI